MDSLKGKRAMVTGGNRGIGAGICRHLARAGVNVAINFIEDEAGAQVLATELTNKHGVKGIAVYGDVADEASVEAMFERTQSELGGLDILVNNAGVESIVAALDLPIAEWDRIMNVNLRGAFLCSQAAARQMKDHGGGVIINNTSIHQEVARLGVVHYAVSKAGLHMLTRALALEWAEFGIRVVGVAPGAIETEINRDEIAAFGKDKFEAWIPEGRLGQVDDIAAAVTFLASAQASYITGQTITIDGGYSINVIRYDPREAS